MRNFYQRFLDRFRHKRPAGGGDTLNRKYTAYRRLLTHNSGSLATLSDMEMLLREHKPFCIDDMTAYVAALVDSVQGIVTSLNDLCGGKYEELGPAVERIGVEIQADLIRPPHIEPTPLVLPLSAIDRGSLAAAGGKGANYGEVANKAGMPVSPGFSITAYACHRFLGETGLWDAIEARLKGLNVADTEALNRASADLMALVRGAEPPRELAEAVAAQVADLAAALGKKPRLSVRSSAAGEDSEASFAGQYSSVLGVDPDKVLEAYKEVVASTFTPRAIFYRRTKGYGERDVIMSSLCLVMVEALSSGVMYTCDPTDASVTDVIISAAFGLGVSVVDGSAAVDIYRVNRETGAVVKTVAAKDHRVVMAPGGGTVDEPLSGGQGMVACLDDAEIAQLVAYGLKLEAHYQEALDIEWAKDAGGKIIILQARPLNPPGAAVAEGETAKAETAPFCEIAHPVLFEGGHAASPGVAHGTVFVLRSDEQLSEVPEGVILVAPQTSPAYVSIMGRLRGIITDLGSVTGHMAAVAREFELPTLVAAESATVSIPTGADVTIDASRRRVYLGRVEPLLSLKKKTNPMAGSPVFARAREALKKIAPLTLTDPHARNFTPAGCVTLHDVIRLAHEISMREMFRIGDDLSDEGNAVRLRVHLPMILYCVDIGGGLSATSGKGPVMAADLASRPFQALLRGMLHEGVVWSGAVGMDLSGLGSIMTQSLFSDVRAEDRFGGPNYAVISKEYLNFNARLGYHFAVVDSYLGDNPGENYMAFSFKGGAADLSRRERRAKFIAKVLERLGMRVERKADMIKGDLKEAPPEVLTERLDQLGRLLGSVRLLDTAITDDSQIEWYTEEFFKGNYTFAKPVKEPQAADTGS